MAIFSFLCLGIALVNKKGSLASPLGTACRYQSLWEKVDHNAHVVSRPRSVCRLFCVFMLNLCTQYLSDTRLFSKLVMQEMFFFLLYLIQFYFILFFYFFFFFFFFCIKYFLTFYTNYIIWIQCACNIIFF